MDKKITTKNSEKNDKGAKSSYSHFLRELLNRVSWVFGAFVVAAIIGFEFKDIIQNLLVIQLNNLHLSHLQAISDGQPTLWITLYVGILGALPFFAYHTYRLLEPIIGTTHSYALKTAIASGVLAIIGVSYSFIVTIPASLSGIADSGASASMYDITTDTFLHFVINNSLALAVIFQIPLMMLFIRNVQHALNRKIQWIRWLLIPAAIIIIALTTSYTTVGRGIIGLSLGTLPIVLLFAIGLILVRFTRPQRMPVVSSGVDDYKERDLELDADVKNNAATHVAEENVQINEMPVAASVTNNVEEKSLFDAIDEEKEAIKELPLDLPSMTQPLTQHVEAMSEDVAQEEYIGQAEKEIIAEPVVSAPAPTQAKVVIQPRFRSGIATQQQTQRPVNRRPLVKTSSSRAMPWSQNTLTPEQRARIQELQIQRDPRLQQKVPFGMQPKQNYPRTLDGLLIA